MKKRTPQEVAIIIVLILGGLFLNKFLLHNSDRPTIGSVLNIMAHDLNKSLPLDLDANTKVTKAEYVPPRSLRIKYVLHDFDSVLFDLKYFRDSTGHELCKKIMTDPSFKLLRDSSVYFEFQYDDTTGRLVHKFRYGPEDYR
jgi:hypothetical protein